MTAPDVETIRARHVATDVWRRNGVAYTACDHDGDPWPCDAAVLADRLAAVLAECSRLRRIGERVEAGHYITDRAIAIHIAATHGRIRRAATGEAT